MAQTFTFTDAEGVEHRIEALYDVDQWTGREMRTVETICGGSFDGTGFLATTSMVLAVSVARALPGTTIEDADRQLNFGMVRRAIREMRVQRDAELQAQADALVDEPDEVVLSPTSADEPTEAAPSA